MQSIREIVEIKSHRLEFLLPASFDAKRVEMTLRPLGRTSAKIAAKLTRFFALTVLLATKCIVLTRKSTAYYLKKYQPEENQDESKKRKHVSC